MFNNINENNKELLYNSQMNAGKVVNLTQLRSAYNRQKDSKNPYVDKTEISSNAMELFQRDLDINKFTKLAISDPEDKSYITRVNALFAEGVVDVFEDDVIPKIAKSKKLLHDIKTFNS